MTVVDRVRTFLHAVVIIDSKLIDENPLERDLAVLDPPVYGPESIDQSVGKRLVIDDVVKPNVVKHPGHELRELLSLELCCVVRSASDEIWLRIVLGDPRLSGINARLNHVVYWQVTRLLLACLHVH